MKFLILPMRRRAARVSRCRVPSETCPCSTPWSSAQGLGAELQPLAARELGYAAGRYGHLMFPENAHEPALQLSRQLLHGPGQGWGSRVFYSDDG